MAEFIPRKNIPRSKNEAPLCVSSPICGSPWFVDEKSARSAIKGKNLIAV
jgi:hypothetical protein